MQGYIEITELDKDSLKVADKLYVTNEYCTEMMKRSFANGKEEQIRNGTVIHKMEVVWRYNSISLDRIPDVHNIDTHNKICVFADALKNIIDLDHPGIDKQIVRSIFIKGVEWYQQELDKISKTPDYNIPS